MAPLAPIPYRLRIGVTGHRVLPDTAAVALRVREVLEESVRECFAEPPLTRATPWAFTVITSLAEGADRVVAREVLRTCDAEIEAVLPFPAGVYRDDFRTEDSRREFDELCALATADRGVRVAGTKGHDAESGAAERGPAYLRAGHAVVDRCDILVAIWDGQPARGVGGTANVIAYARQRNRPLVLVAHDGLSPARIEKGAGLPVAALQRLETFNTFGPVTKAEHDDEASEYEHMFGPTSRGHVPSNVRQLIRTRLVPYFVRASSIAKRNKRDHTGAGLLAYVLSPLAVAAVALGALAHEAALWGGLAELLLLSTILLIVFQADRHKVHKHWIEARYVAERVRSAILCVACGVTPSRTGVPPWLVHTGGADAWAFRAADEIVRRIGVPAPLPREATAGALEFVRDVWLDEQARYHERRSVEVGGVSRGLERAGKWTFVAALAVAVVHVATLLVPNEELLRPIESPVLFLALVLPALGAAIGGIRTHRELSRLERRHQAMAGIVRQLLERCATGEPEDDLVTLVREIEEVMLDESGEWLALMRFARIEAT